MAVSIKNANDIAKMRSACRLASEVLDYITPFVVAGVTTGDLDRLCYDYMRNVQGTIAAPLNYQPPGCLPSQKQHVFLLTMWCVMGSQAREYFTMAIN
jgi:methionyl aminopeptidase